MQCASKSDRQREGVYIYVYVWNGEKRWVELFVLPYRHMVVDNELCRLQADNLQTYFVLNIWKYAEQNTKTQNIFFY